MEAIFYVSSAKAPLPPTEPVDPLPAYCAEYNAMATRINTFIALQFVPWPPLAVLLGLVVNAFKIHDGRTFEPTTASLIIWLTVMAMQVAVFVYCFALYEVYNHARYVETELRPKLSTIIGIDRNWGYEKFLKRAGRANNPNYGDRGVLGISILAILFGIYLQWNSGLKVLDGILAMANVFVLYKATGMVSRVVKARENIFVEIAA